MKTKHRECCVDHGTYYTQCPACPELPTPPFQELVSHEIDPKVGFSHWGPPEAFTPLRKTILILGYGRHGKDTLAELLKKLFGYSFISSSYFAAERVMMPYFESIGRPYASVDECFADRHTDDNRALWYQQISAYNTPRKDRLPSEIMEVADIYVGMRANDEYLASRHLFDMVLWVDRSEHEPPEGESSMDIEYDPETMIWIDNNGTTEDLAEEVEFVFDIIRKVR